MHVALTSELHALTSPVSVEWSLWVLTKGKKKINNQGKFNPRAHTVEEVSQEKDLFELWSLCGVLRGFNLYSKKFKIMQIEFLCLDLLLNLNNQKTAQVLTSPHSKTLTTVQKY